ncbi:DinB family protein [Paenibacillus sp. P26]|nr:DinB family protein [Paenibacillus sp. P26]
MSQLKTMEAYRVIDAYKMNLLRYSPEQLRHIPAEGTWSLCQLYDHMILTALDYLDMVEKCAESGEGQELGKTEGGEELFRLGGFPPVKIKSPDGPENSPDNTASKDDLMHGLDQVVLRMKEWEKILETTPPEGKVKHDGFGWLNGREWFELIGMHFRHHLRQKNELEQHWLSSHP